MNIWSKVNRYLLFPESSISVETRSRLIGACNSTVILSRRFLRTFFLDRIFLVWDFLGGAMTDHKKRVDVTASLDRRCLFSQKIRYTKNRSVCKNAVTLGAPTHRLLLKLRATIVSTSLVRKMTHIDPYSYWFFFPFSFIRSSFWLFLSTSPMPFEWTALVVFQRPWLFILLRLLPLF